MSLLARVFFADSLAHPEVRPRDAVDLPDDLRGLKLVIETLQAFNTCLVPIRGLSKPFIVTFPRTSQAREQLHRWSISQSRAASSEFAKDPRTDWLNEREEVASPSCPTQPLRSWRPTQQPPSSTQ